MPSKNLIITKSRGFLEEVRHNHTLNRLHAPGSLSGSASGELSWGDYFPGWPRGVSCATCFSTVCPGHSYREEESVPPPLESEQVGRLLVTNGEWQW